MAEGMDSYADERAQMKALQRVCCTCGHIMAYHMENAHSVSLKCCAPGCTCERFQEAPPAKGKGA